jgi:hypothetical protein
VIAAVITSGVIGYILGVASVLCLVGYIVERLPD